MTIEEAQKEVDKWIKTIGVRVNLQHNVYYLQ